MMPSASKRILAVAILGAVSLASCRESRTNDTTVRVPAAPVILISIDTLRADRLPAYGYERGKTPALDRFRQDAILYENAYSHCPLTLPAHVSMLTGLLPPEHGVRNNLGFTFHPRGPSSLPQILRLKGYATAAMVSSFVLRGETGLASLFDTYDASVAPTPGLPVSEYVRDGAQTTRLAKSWIDQRDSAPFFLMLHLYEPHAPWTPPASFSGSGFDAYDDEIAYADSIVGDLLAHLRSTGVYDRSIIIVVSDHGEGLGDHGEMQHGILLYREALHVPMLLKLPGQKRGGSTIETPAQLIDILPTVTSLVGVDRPPGLSGESLLDLPESRQIYGETLYPQLQLGWSALQSTMDERYHFIDSPSPELFDITIDPEETRNVIDDLRRHASLRRNHLASYSTDVAQIEDVDPETAKKLAALGYVGASRSVANAEAPDPKSAIREMARIEEGFRLASERKFERAASLLAEVVREHPGMIDIWIKLGEIYQQSNDLDRSAAAYREAMTRSLRVSPDLVLAVADVHLAKGEFSQARSHAELALDADPTRAHETLARIALLEGRLDVAEREARTAIDHASGSFIAPMLVFAEVLQKQGHLDAALEAIAEAERLSASRGLGQVYGLEFLRGDTLARNGLPNEAMAAYEREITSFPHSRQAYANLAVIQFIGQRPDKMNSTLERLVAANPDRQSYDLASRTLEVLGEHEAAAAWRRRAPRDGAL